MSRLVLLLLLLTGGCRYLGDRGLDFLDAFAISVGAGSTIGVRGAALGLVDTGIMAGVKPNATALGWRYGKPLFLNAKDGRYDADNAVIIKANSIRNFDYSNGTYDSARDSVAILPALFTWTDATPEKYEWTVPEEGTEFEKRHWLWSKEAVKNNRYAQIHAFDIEAEVAIGVYIRSGFSPGEALDFLLGIVGIDIADDDNRMVSERTQLEQKWDHMWKKKSESTREQKLAAERRELEKHEQRAAEKRKKVEQEEKQ